MVLLSAHHPFVAYASATIYTMVEMAKAHKLNVEKYLTFLLTQRPQMGMSDEELEKLVPWSDEARAFCGYAQQTAFIVSATDNHGLEGRERTYKMADIGGSLP